MPRPQGNRRYPCRYALSTEASRPPRQAAPASCRTTWRARLRKRTADAQRRTESTVLRSGLSCRLPKDRPLLRFPILRIGGVSALEAVAVLYLADFRRRDGCPRHIGLRIILDHVLGLHPMPLGKGLIVCLCGVEAALLRLIDRFSFDLEFLTQRLGQSFAGNDALHEALDALAVGARRGGGRKFAFPNYRTRIEQLDVGIQERHIARAGIRCRLDLAVGVLDGAEILRQSIELIAQRVRTGEALLILSPPHLRHLDLAVQGILLPGEALLSSLQLFLLAETTILLLTGEALLTLLRFKVRQDRQPLIQIHRS